MTLPRLLPLAVVFSLPAVAADPVDFDHQIRPLLSDHCGACHGPDEASREADLRLDVEEEVFRERRGRPLIVRGDGASSDLVRRLRSDDPTS